MAVSILTHGIRGYASVFGVLDSAGTIVDKGAFLRSIANVIPRCGCGHALVKNTLGTSLPIGVITALREDARGLYYEAKLHDTQAAREALEAVNDGSMTGASFAFDTLTADGYESDDGVLHLTSLDLIELGPVAFPSNAQATCEVYELAAAPASDDEAGARSDDYQTLALMQWAAQEIKR